MIVEECQQIRTAKSALAPAPDAKTRQRAPLSTGGARSRYVEEVGGSMISSRSLASLIE